MTKMERRQYKHNKKITNLVQCPMCNAQSYPEIEIVEGEAHLICKSCQEDMTIYFEAIKEFQEKYKDFNKVEEPVNG